MLVQLSPEFNDYYSGVSLVICGEAVQQFLGQDELPQQVEVVLHKEFDPNFIEVRADKSFRFPENSEGMFERRYLYGGLDRMLDEFGLPCYVEIKVV